MAIPPGMSHPSPRRHRSGLLALALFALGYLGLPVVDAASQHAAHAVQSDVASVGSGSNGTGHRCLLPDAFGATHASAPIVPLTAAPAESPVEVKPCGVILPRSIRGHARPRAPPHS